MPESSNPRLDIETKGDVTIVRFLNCKILGEPGPEIGIELNALVDQGRRHLVLDLGGVEYLYSAALGMIIGLQKRLQDVAFFLRQLSKLDYGSDAVRRNTIAAAPFAFACLRDFNNRRSPLVDPN